ncbi:hypothetical protein [Prescottella equi]|uniref:Uncharacterized protein n=1 Tax=Rhodococcus hoagii TaxID=43767 RepID=A0A0F6WFQ5_RHOHA|nr:hypothetical protein [Prescottella equi]AKF16019.1 hypothetical protein pVAPN2012_0600 [Prescottella equi]AKG90519.1 hypothetical protein pVAPN_0600 [Prescottella equi]ARX59666.1 hypothetical protein pVAPN1204_0600 [Prescottella equi]ARX59809.1 hypothetical protein pVAPN1354_0600 [Prescottella equi]ARX59956.1 hypothetical protein pVAPN1557_0600 [Prescottella equi]
MRDHDGMSRTEKAGAIAKEVVRDVVGEIVVDVAVNHLPWVSWLQDLVSLWPGG